MSDIELGYIKSFFNKLNIHEFEEAKKYCSFPMQYFDPLFGYLSGQEVVSMWKITYSINGFRLFELEEISNLGDGYYKVKAKLLHKPIQNRNNHQSVQLHIRIENEKITEYSEAFSLHKMAHIQSPFWGWLLGWNRYYQNRMKIKARRDLHSLMNA